MYITSARAGSRLWGSAMNVINTGIPDGAVTNAKIADTTILPGKMNPQIDNVYLQADVALSVGGTWVQLWDMATTIGSSYLVFVHVTAVDTQVADTITIEVYNGSDTFLSTVVVFTSNSDTVSVSMTGFNTATTAHTYVRAKSALGTVTVKDNASGGTADSLCLTFQIG